MSSIGSSASGSNQWEPPSPEALRAMLPQYEISAIIGRGGMGAVYRGRQAKLDHPAIISVFDFGETSEGQL